MIQKSFKNFIFGKATATGNTVTSLRRFSSTQICTNENCSNFYYFWALARGLVHK